MSLSDVSLGRVILFVKNTDRLVAFYRDGLGLRASPSDRDAPGFVTLDAGSCQLCLHEIPEAYARDIQIDEPPKARSETPIKLAFACSDVEAVRARLASLGAQMGDVRGSGPATTCDGLDPEGNVFQLASR